MFCFVSPLLQVYYANHDQSSTQWQHPRTGRRKTVGENLPFGWERKILSDNKVFLLLPEWSLTILLFEVVYVDLVNKKTTFTDPRLAFAKETVTASATFWQKFDSGSTALEALQTVSSFHIFPKSRQFFFYWILPPFILISSFSFKQIYYYEWINDY